MESLNIADLISLTENNKTDEAAKIVSDYFDNLPPEEKGKAYVALASIYMQMVAENNQKMANLLDLQLMQLKEIDKAEKEMLENAELEDVRSKLN